VSNVKLTIGSVVLRRPHSASQSLTVVQRSLEAGLVRSLGDSGAKSFKDAKVLRVRLPTASANANIGTAISGAIVRALKKGH
jgi:ABC-type enterobactin transport system permease subunit